MINIPNYSNKPDEQLIEIINSKITDKFKNDEIIAAHSELHKRQKKIDTSTNKMTLWILLFTIGIAILTIILVAIAVKDRLPITENEKPTMIQPFPQQHTPAKDNKNH
jgi:hypothetical protein